MGYESHQKFEVRTKASDCVSNSHRILTLSFDFRLVSDFFCPNTGGVETHIYHLGGCLLELGHSVIVITHTYGERQGIRHLSNGLKVSHFVETCTWIPNFQVYHLPFFCFSGIIIPSVLGSLYWYRKIFLLEQIDIVHGHSVSGFWVSNFIFTNFRHFLA